MKLGFLMLIGLLPAAALAQEPQSQTVTVTGAVMKPGTVAVPPNGITILQALELAGRPQARC
jgi:protein involved in polysaccharide export with SLBB domain